MYFKGVNRGMAFTKAGFYLTGLAFLAGLLATGSGSNALFLTLGLGLSALVVSGILSEKVMRHCRVRAVESVQVSAGTPFSIPVHVHNSHPRNTLYGVEIFIDRRKPKYRLIPKAWPMEFYGNVLRVGPQSAVSVPARSHGLKRGAWKEVFLTQATLFPFNLVRKYKVDSIHANVLILPPLDLELLHVLNDEVHARALLSVPSSEFFSHRPVYPSDSHRNVDWKKSTLADPQSWILKVFQEHSPQFGILICPQWSDLTAMTNAEAHERFLARVQTAIEFCKRENKPFHLMLTTGQFADDHAQALAAFPHFGKDYAAFLSSQPCHVLGRGEFVTLRMGATVHKWEQG